MLAVGTQQKRLDGLRNLFNVAIQYGLLDVNPFSSMKTKAPRGAEEKSYRAFHKEELKAIFDLLRLKRNPDRLWVVRALLCTGARAAELLKLRHSDIAQTEADVWYLNFKYQLTDVYNSAEGCSSRRAQNTVASGIADNQIPGVFAAKKMKVMSSI